MEAEFLRQCDRLLRGSSTQAVREASGYLEGLRSSRSATELREVFDTCCGIVTSPSGSPSHALIAAQMMSFICIRHSVNPSIEAFLCRLCEHPVVLSNRALRACTVEALAAVLCRQLMLGAGDMGHLLHTLGSVGGPAMEVLLSLPAMVVKDVLYVSLQSGVVPGSGSDFIITGGARVSGGADSSKKMKTALLSALLQPSTQQGVFAAIDATMAIAPAAALRAAAGWILLSVFDEQPDGEGCGAVDRGGSTSEAFTIWSRSPTFSAARGCISTHSLSSAGSDLFSAAVELAAALAAALSAANAGRSHLVCSDADLERAAGLFIDPLLQCVATASTHCRPDSCFDSSYGDDDTDCYDDYDNGAGDDTDWSRQFEPSVVNACSVVALALLPAGPLCSSPCAAALCELLERSAELALARRSSSGGWAAGLRLGSVVCSTLEAVVEALPAELSVEALCEQSLLRTLNSLVGVSAVPVNASCRVMAAMYSRCSGYRKTLRGALRQLLLHRALRGAALWLLLQAAAALESYLSSGSGSLASEAYLHAASAVLPLLRSVAERSAADALLALMCSCDRVAEDRLLARVGASLVAELLALQRLSPVAPAHSSEQGAARFLLMSLAHREDGAGLGWPFRLKQDHIGYISLARLAIPEPCLKLAQCSAVTAVAGSDLADEQLWTRLSTGISAVLSARIAADPSAEVEAVCAQLLASLEDGGLCVSVATAVLAKVASSVGLGGAEPYFSTCKSLLHLAGAAQTLLCAETAGHRPLLLLLPLSLAAARCCSDERAAAVAASMAPPPSPALLLLAGRLAASCSLTHLLAVLCECAGAAARGEHTVGLGRALEGCLLPLLEGLAQPLSPAAGVLSAEAAKPLCALAGACAVPLRRGGDAGRASAALGRVCRVLLLLQSAGGATGAAALEVSPRLVDAVVSYRGEADVGVSLRCIFLEASAMGVGNRCSHALLFNLWRSVFRALDLVPALPGGLPQLPHSAVGDEVVWSAVASALCDFVEVVASPSPDPSPTAGGCFSEGAWGAHVTLLAMLLGALPRVEGGEAELDEEGCLTAAAAKSATLLPSPRGHPVWLALLGGHAAALLRALLLCCLGVAPRTLKESVARAVQKFFIVFGCTEAAAMYVSALAAVHVAFKGLIGAKGAAAAAAAMVELSARVAREGMSRDWKRFRGALRMIIK